MEVGGVEMRLLMVDDNEALQDVIKKLMSILEYEVDIVGNGLEAVSKVVYDQIHYDLCIMDVEMPTMNGLEATRLIRENQYYLPIIGISGTPCVGIECYGAGMNDFLAKPFSLEHLSEKILKNLKIHQS